MLVPIQLKKKRLFKLDHFHIFINFHPVFMVQIRNIIETSNWAAKKPHLRWSFHDVTTHQCCPNRWRKTNWVMKCTSTIPTLSDSFIHVFCNHFYTPENEHILTYPLKKRQTTISVGNKYIFQPNHWPFSGDSRSFSRGGWNHLTYLGGCLILYCGRGRPEAPFWQSAPHLTIQTSKHLAIWPRQFVLGVTSFYGKICWNPK